MVHPPEMLAIPLEDTTLPGYFCAVDTTRRPLVISVGGYDSTAEESFFWNAAAAGARGYHALIFDGPGQGEMLIERSPTGWALRRGMLTHGVPTPWDYFIDAARYEQEDLCEKDYLRFTAEEGAGEHCVSGNRALFHERVFDWLDARISPYFGVRWNSPPESASSSIQSEPSGASSISRIRLPMLQR